MQPQYISCFPVASRDDCDKLIRSLKGKWEQDRESPWSCVHVDQRKWIKLMSNLIAWSAKRMRVQVDIGETWAYALRYPKGVSRGVHDDQTGSEPYPKMSAIMALRGPCRTKLYLAGHETVFTMVPGDALVFPSRIAHEVPETDAKCFKLTAFAPGRPWR